MRDRRGVAMVAALWLVVAISVVVLQFALSAKERRVLGLAAADRGTGRGVAMGALAVMQARLDQALRTMPQGNAALAGTRSADPWMNVDSVFSGIVEVDSVPVDVRATDLGTMINVNQVTDTMLKAFFNFVIGDYVKSGALADVIADWRDPDELRRTNGDERNDYIKKGLLALPTNVPFRDVSELQLVEGMTQEMYDKLAPYATTFGSGIINLNTAPVIVLRALPGMTDEIMNNILNQRSRGLRISSVSQVVPGQAAGGRGRGGAQTSREAMATLQVNQLTRAAGVNTTDVLLTIVAQTGPQALPVKLTALIQRNGTTATVAWVHW